MMEGRLGVVGEGVISALCTRCRCEPKTTLKIKSIKNNPMYYDFPGDAVAGKGLIL